jgi:membrane peptidoglycan carboxypeptidase
LAMVGSRDYFYTTIDGNFNAATGLRQPGSTFKPIVYAVLFNKGYTPETILWDVPTQFSTSCAVDNFTTTDICYSPGNYDDRFRGPMTIRNALAQSVNIPAVQATYLAGVKDSVKLAQDLGVKNLTNSTNYGLSIVLGGGSVSLLDMTTAYSTFANDGIRTDHTPIKWLEDDKGNIIDRHIPFPVRAVPANTARTISDILSDNIARTPGFGANSVLYIPYREVAVKTGTSNDYRDAWIVGYTPNLTVGAWVGNTDNSAMARRVAGLIVSPMWREFMDQVLPSTVAESFIPPEPLNHSELKPVLKGEVGPVPHSILHWVDRNNPTGPSPSNPSKDSQYSHWEYAVNRWVQTSGYGRQTFPNEENPFNNNLNPNPEPTPMGEPGFIPVTTF